MQLDSIGRWALALTIHASAGAAHAAIFAAEVTDYDAGAAVRNDGFLSRFTNASAVLGSPDGLTGEKETGFPNTLNPFSPAYESDEIALVGEGGRLTVRLPNYATVGAGREIGVFTNAGLQDASFTTGAAPGANFNPAKTFGGGSAEVLVSENGDAFVSLGVVQFNLPSNFYQNAGGPFDTTAPANPVLADFGKPFEGSLADFDGADFSQTISLLGGSAGGTWLDLSGSGLSRVGFVQFRVADTTAGIDRLGIDALSIANDHVGAAVPEPSTMAVVLATPLLLRRRRA